VGGFGERSQPVGEVAERGVAGAEVEVRLEDAERELRTELTADGEQLPVGEEADAPARAEPHDEELHAQPGADIPPARLGRDEAGGEVRLVDVERLQPDVLEAPLDVEPEPG